MGAVTARALFQAHIDGLTALDVSTLPVPISAAWTMEEAVGDIDIVNLASGPTTLAMPQGATMLIIIPPPTNVIPIVLKGIAADTGVALNPNCATILTLALTTIVLQTTAAISTVRLIWL